MATEVTSNKRMHMAILSDREVVMSRVFDAPRALMFKIYTDPKHIPQFWGPGKYTTIVDRLEVRVGGIWRFIQWARHAWRAHWEKNLHSMACLKKSILQNDWCTHSSLKVCPVT